MIRGLESDRCGLDEEGETVMRAALFLAICSLIAGCAPGTHLRQPSQQLIVLQSASGDTGCAATTAGLTFRRVFQDGTGALQPFQMPPNRSLVITDVDWQYRHPNAAAGGGWRIVLRLFLQSLADPSHQESVFESTIFLNADGEGGTSEAMTSGFVMTDAAQLCIDTGEEPKGPPFGLQHVVLRGYLL
jgi:hypothetical protein